MFDDFDTQIQCEEVYNEEMYEAFLEMQKEFAEELNEDWVNGPIVKRSKTSPFHGEDTGSSPVGITT